MTAARLSVTTDMVTGSAVVTTQTQPIRAERFTAAHTEDAQKTADQLTRMSQAIADATASARSNPDAAPLFFNRVRVGTGGAKTIIRHGLGKRVHWWIVGWSGNVTITSPDLICDELDGVDLTITDNDKLALRSYVAGFVDLAVA